MKTIKDSLVIIEYNSVAMIPWLKTYASSVQFGLLSVFMLAYIWLKDLKKILIFFFITIQLLLGGFLLAHTYLDIQWIDAVKGFYILAEIFAAVTSFILLFAFFNQHFSLKEAKWVYPFLLILGNIATIPIALSLSAILGLKLPAISHFSNHPMTSSAVLLLSIPFIVFCLQKLGNRTESLLPPSIAKPVSIPFTTGYFVLLAIFIFCILIAQHVITPPWQLLVKETYLDIKDYTSFLGQFSVYKSKITLATIIIGSFVFFFIRWSFAALILPVFLVLAGLLTVFFTEHPDILANMFALDMELIEIKLWILSAFKISLSGILPIFFFALKEMAYIPLPLHIKTVGKVSLELLAKYFSKAGALAIGSVLFFADDTAMPQPQNFWPYVVTMLGMISLISAVLLGKMRRKLIA